MIQNLFKSKIPVSSKDLTMTIKFSEHKPVDFLESGDYKVCFVNTNKAPQRVNRLSLIRYNEINDQFFQLCEYVYISEFAEFKVLVWEDICIPAYKKASVILICNAMAGIS